MKKHTLILSGILALALCVGCGDSAEDPSADAASNTDTATANDTNASTDTGTAADTSVAADTAVTADTNTPPEDTATPPPVQPNQGLICPGILNCVNTELQKCPQGDQTCQQTALGTCSGQAKTPQESQYFGAFLNCQISCLQESGNQFTKGTVQCLEEKCADEQATCLSGNVYGAGNCAGIDPCAKTCNPMDTSGECVRACLQAATQEAVTNYLGISLCVQVACFNPAAPQSPPSNECAGQAQQAGGACNDIVTQCMSGMAP